MRRRWHWGYKYIRVRTLSDSVPYLHDAHRDLSHLSSELAQRRVGIATHAPWLQFSDMTWPCYVTFHPDRSALQAVLHVSCVVRSLCTVYCIGYNNSVYWRRRHPDWVTGIRSMILPAKHHTSDILCSSLRIQRSRCNNAKRGPVITRKPKL